MKYTFDFVDSMLYIQNSNRFEIKVKSLKLKIDHEIRNIWNKTCIYLDIELLKIVVSILSLTKFYSSFLINFSAKDIWSILTAP